MLKACYYLAKKEVNYYMSNLTRVINGTVPLEVKEETTVFLIFYVYI